MISRKIGSNVTLFGGIFSIVVIAHTMADPHGLGAFWHVVPFAAALTSIKSVAHSVNDRLGKRFKKTRLFSIMYGVASLCLVFEGKALLVALTVPVGTACLKTLWCIHNSKVWKISHH